MSNPTDPAVPDPQAVVPEPQPQPQPDVVVLPQSTYQQFAPIPQPMPEQQQAPKPKKTGLVIVTVFTVLFFGAAGAFGALFVLEKQNSHQLSEQVTAKDKEVKAAKEEMSKARNDQKKAEDAQKRAENETAQVAKCRDAARAFREASLGEDEQKWEKALDAVFINC